MKVFGWSADKAGPGYYRLALPMRELRRAYDDIETTVDTTIDLGEAETMDLIVGQRIAKDANTVWWQQQARAGRPLVFEIDDDLWRVHPSNFHAHREWARPAMLAKLTRNVEAASAVTVSTPFLAEVVSQWNSNVHVLPNCIDAALLTHQRPKRDTLTVGWAGSATHLMDFKIAEQPLTRYFRKYPAVDMHFMGTDYSPMIRKPSRVTGWVGDLDAYHRAIDFDIGIAPLADDVFNYSKSPIKALEYAALGIPVVASDVGPYRDFVQHGVTGFLCRDDHDWFRYLRMLTEDAALRETMGAAARVQAGEHTIEGNAWRWREAYESVLAPVAA